MAEEKNAGAGGEPEAETKKAARAKEPLFRMEDSDIPQNLPDATWSTKQLAEAALTDKSMLVRSNAVNLLGDRREEEAVATLITALKDQEQIVRSSAMVKLASRGMDVRDNILAALSDEEPDIRAGAAWVLGELKDPTTVEDLKRAALDDSMVVRLNAKASLLAMGIKP